MSGIGLQQTQISAAMCAHVAWKGFSFFYYKNSCQQTVEVSTSR